MRRFLSEEMQKRPPTELVTVRRWQRIAAAEGIWGSLTKCGVTESVMNHRSHDGPSCRFVMKIREVAPDHTFVVTSSLMQMLTARGLFLGLPSKDPHAHIAKVRVVCESGAPL